MAEENPEDLKEEELETLKEVFDYYDNNKNGFITTEEIFKVMKLVGLSISKSELGDMMAEIDDNGTGTIEFLEFVELMTKRWKDFDIEDSMKTAFGLFDKDHEDFISSNELKTMMDAIFPGKFTEREISAMIKENNEKGVDFLTFDDFKRIVWQDK